MGTVHNYLVSLFVPQVAFYLMSSHVRFIVYELIPATDFMRHLKSAINWSFENKYCRVLYSKKGRPVMDAQFVNIHTNLSAFY
jgi:hypothetical protein